MRLLVVGGGSIGERHVRCFLKARPGLRVELCEPRAARRRELLARYPLAAAHADFGKLDFSLFRAAVLATPANLHLEQAARLADAGCHLLIEKPLCVHVRERAAARALMRRCAARKLVAAVAYTYRSYPQLERMAARLHEIGEPRAMRTRLAYDYPRYRPDWRRNYFARRSSGGGAVMDIASHGLSAMTKLLGPVASVQAMTARLGLAPIAVEDTASLLLRFRSGAVGEVWVSACQRRREAEIEVMGGRGHLVWRNRFDGTDELSFCRGDGDVPRVSRRPLDADAPFVAQARGFLRAVERGERPRTTLAEALHVQEILWAALRSAATGRREKVRGRA